MTDAQSSTPSNVITIHIDPAGMRRTADTVKLLAALGDAFHAMAREAQARLSAAGPALTEDGPNLDLSISVQDSFASATASASVSDTFGSVDVSASINASIDTNGNTSVSGTLSASW